MVTPCSSENGALALGRHFTEVSRRDVTTRATFADHAAAAAYVASFDPRWYTRSSASRDHAVRRLHPVFIAA